MQICLVRNETIARQLARGRTALKDHEFREVGTSRNPVDAVRPDNEI
jgi:hypothetical protein